MLHVIFTRHTERVPLYVTIYQEHLLLSDYIARVDAEMAYRYALYLTLWSAGPETIADTPLSLTSLTIVQKVIPLSTNIRL